MPGRPPALSPAQKRAIAKMVKENATVRNEIKRLVADQVNKVIASLVFVPSTTGTPAPKKRKKRKKRRKAAKKVVKKAKKAGPKKAKKVAKKAKKAGPKKKRRYKKKRVAPTGKRQCKKCKKTMQVHPRSQNCPKCGAEKSLKKVK